jgi:ribosome modulation factor
VTKAQKAIYQQGYDARMDGKGRFNYPREIGPAGRLFWLNGWYDANTELYRRENSNRV